ncbi:MAG: hypothetical protein OZ932_10545 [Flavobacteriia bacterium]|nr:hypothetical protein [Flavobacteriia bacterium]
MVREALRYMEERDERVQLLRRHLSEGAEQAAKGQFGTGCSLDGLLSGLDA